MAGGSARRSFFPSIPDPPLVPKNIRLAVISKPTGFEKGYQLDARTGAGFVTPQMDFYRSRFFLPTRVNTAGNVMINAS